MTNAKIVRLQAENVKRLRAVEITPDGAVVVVSGRNGQGKSSVLDAIWMALGGKRAIPRRPVRDGAEEASIRLELEGLIIERRIKPDGRTSLVVSSPEGARFPSPQAMLDKLVGALSFDPLAFSRMEPKRQRDLLSELVGIDTSAIDEERARTYAARTDVGRDLKRAKGALASLTHHEGAPAEPVSVAELTAELREADRLREAARAARGDVDDAANDLDAHAEQLRRMRNQRDELEQHLAQLRQQIEEAEQRTPQLAARRAELEETATKAEAAIPDRAAIESRLAEADQVNAKVRDNARYLEAGEAVAQLDSEWAALTAELERIDEAKRHALDAAAFPLEGLGLDGEGVLLDGLPFEQASSAQQLRASVAIGLALNPELRVLLVRDGSLLDDESMGLLAELAAEADAQVWLERVGDSELGVVIEDGEVAS